MATQVALDALLDAGRSIVLDGALATELEARGLDLSSDLWSAQVLQTNPETIYNVHLDYYRAGADVAITASYQATSLGFKEHLGFSAEQSAELIKNSVQVAQQARDQALKELESLPIGPRMLLVAGSVGPYGAYLSNGAEYTGDYKIGDKEMKDFHRDRIQALVDAGVDLLACETMPNVDEIRCLLELLKEEFPATRAWVSCTLRDSQHLSDGTPLPEVVKLVDMEPQIIAFGVNCIPEQDVSPALDSLRPLTSKPVVVYPNSGETWDAKDRQWHGARAQGQTLATIISEWHDKGARLVGGCCRTGPADIKIVRQTLDSKI